MTNNRRARTTVCKQTLGAKGRLATFYLKVKRNAVNLKRCASGEPIEIEIGIGIKIENHCNDNSLVPDSDIDSDSEKTVFLSTTAKGGTQCLRQQFLSIG